MGITKIQWTNKSWNIVTGCSHDFQCWDRCYARNMANRLQKMGVKKYQNITNKGFAPTFHPEELGLPVTWKKPCKIFVCSMGDLFNIDVPDDWVNQVFETIQNCPQHIFQILTKRPDRMKNYFFDKNYRYMVMKNLWIGTTIESTQYYSRKYELDLITAKTKFLSCEPLIGRMPIMDLSSINWIIVGCESGPKARPMNLDWVREIRDQCVSQNIPFFFKQAMVNGKLVKMPELDGRVYDQYPGE